jgi:hypothetical protein
VSFTRVLAGVGLQVLYHGVLDANGEFDPHESITFARRVSTGVSNVNDEFLTSRVLTPVYPEKLL